MDHVKILKRAWETTWRYRALWIFGIILALTTGGGGSGSGGGSGGGGGGGGGNGNHIFPPRGEFPWSPGEFPSIEMPSEIGNILIIVGVGLVCVIFLMSIVGAIARYVSETALIRMVDEHEETGEKRTIREGFRLGWSRAAWRLFLIKLLITLPIVVGFILLFGMAAVPLLAWATENTALGVIGTVITVGLGLLLTILAIVVGVVASLLVKFFWRACILEDLGVMDAIRYGFDFVKRHFNDVAIMWLIMVGISIGYAIAMVVISILLIPVILLLIVVGGLLGGLPALAVWGLTSLLFDGAVPWILAAVVGLPIFILTLATPWIFLGGLMEVFKSSVWTLTYRELRALERLETVGESEVWPETEDVEYVDEFDSLDDSVVTADDPSDLDTI